MNKVFMIGCRKYDDDETYEHDNAKMKIDMIWLHHGCISAQIDNARYYVSTLSTICIPNPWYD